MGQKLRDELNQVIDSYKLDWVVYGEFSGIRLLVGHGEKDIRAMDFDPYTWDYLKLKENSDSELLVSLRCGLLLNGIDLACNGGMTTAAHSDADIVKTVEAFERTIDWMRDDGLILKSEP